RLEVLRPLGRLRAWLYAVARSECLRRLRSSRAAAAIDEGPRLRDAAAALSTGEQRALRVVLRTAFSGLDDSERDVMTMVWHGLDVAEVAAVLGVSRAEAYAMFTQARDQLEASVGALLLGWSGRADCAELDDMLRGHDRLLTADVRARVGRHAEKCHVCAARRQREMRPGLLLSLSMGALLGEAAEARAAASPAPPGLWEQVYLMTSGQSEDAAWQRSVGKRHVSFGEDGFPRGAGRDGSAWTPRVAVATFGVGAVAVAATATGVIAAGHHEAEAGGPASGSPVSAVMPASPASATARSGGSQTRAPRSGATSPAVSPTALPTAAGRPSVVVTPGGGAAAGSPSYVSSPAGSPAASSSGGSPSSGTPSAATSSQSASASSGSSGTGSSGGSSGTGSSGGSSPSSSPSSSPTQSGSPSASGNATAGTLSVSRSAITLAVAGSSTITLTAEGGPVHWSISVPSGLLGNVSVSQSAGSLAAGQSVQVTVTVSGLLTLDSQLTISPGNEKVTVLLGLL
ncbi:MAG TPA: hypothetical protein VG164_04855, partial [Trebonia sp.]|nr:hypothetical protein [Trebonia sp.]